MQMRNKLLSNDSFTKTRLIDFNNWLFRAANSVPQIHDDHDSGAFICLAAKILSYNLKLNQNQFTNDYIINFKNNLIDDIKKVELSNDDYSIASGETDI